MGRHKKRRDSTKPDSKPAQLPAQSVAKVEEVQEVGTTMENELRMQLQTGINEPMPGTEDIVDHWLKSGTWKRLGSYVHRALAKRDLSHGWDHVNRVSQIVLNLVPYEHARKDQFMQDLITVAWLHDIEDHKYGSLSDDDQQRLKALHMGRSVADQERLRNITKWISWSHQRKLEQEHGREGARKLMQDDLDADALAIRDLVSDADKLDALGQIGWDRCLVYTSYHMQKTGVFGDVHANVVKHCDEKLLQLHEYIVTPKAKKLAGPLTDELRKLRDCVASTLPKPAEPTKSWWPW